MHRRFFLTSLLKTAVAVPLIGTGTSVFLDSTKVFNPFFLTMSEAQLAFFNKDDAFFKALGGGRAGGGKTIILMSQMRIPLKLRPGGYLV